MQYFLAANLKLVIQHQSYQGQFIHGLLIDELLLFFLSLFFLFFKVLYMSFDKFLLAVESRDLSQADKSIIRVSSFPKLSDG